jgi:hypothetical protein
VLGASERCDFALEPFDCAMATPLTARTTTATPTGSAPRVPPWRLIIFLKNFLNTFQRIVMLLVQRACPERRPGFRQLA